VNFSKCNEMRIGRNCILAVYDYNSDVISRYIRVVDIGIVLEHIKSSQCISLFLYLKCLCISVDLS